MPKFSNSDTLVILKDHSSDPGNTPPNATFWTLKSNTNWILSTSYSIGDVVNDGDKFYVANTAHTATYVNEPPNSSFWDIVNIWSNSVDYIIGDLVVYSDIVYSAASAHTSVFGPDFFGDVDISSYMIDGEYEEGVPQSLKLFLNTKGGRFETTGPIIQKFDRIYFESTIGTKTIKDVFHVQNISRSRLGGFGMVMELDCPHQSNELWKRTISFPGRKISGNTSLTIIARQLNSIFSKGVNDPTVEIPTPFNLDTKTGSRLSRNTSNDYINEAVKLETALQVIKDTEIQPVEGGGSKEAMYIRFVSKYDHTTHSDLDTVLFQAFEQGFTNNGGTFNNTPKVTLTYDTVQSGNRPTVLNLETEETPQLATNVIAVGHKKSGSYPTEFQKFLGAKDVFNAAQIWDSTAEYLKGDLIIEDEITYEAKIDNTNIQPPNVTNWIQRTFTKPLQWGIGNLYNIDVIIQNNDIAYKSLQSHTSTANDEPPNSTFWVRVFFPPTVDYSPQTKDRAQDWINFCAGAKYADQNEQGNNSTAVVDHNCVIIDERHPRNPVRSVGQSPTAIPSTHLVGGNIPNGYKMLVVNANYVADPATAVDSGTGDFAGNDPNGIVFAGNIAEYRDPDEDGTGDWFVFKTTDDDEEILDWDENDSWTKDPCGVSQNLAYLDAESVCQLGSRSTTWIRGSYRITNILGFDRVQFISGRTFDCVHPLAYDTINSRVKVENTTILKDDTAGTSAVSFQFEPPANASLEDRRYFAGCNFWSLDPLTANDVPYGGTAPVVGDKIKLSVFDFFNMFKTHELKEEWFGPQVEDYFPIQGFNYSENLKVTIDSIFQEFDLEGNYTMEMWFSDQRHNIVTLEYNHSRNNVTLNQDNTLSKMEAFAGVPGISVSFASPEPEFFDVFQEREWQFGGILTKDSYDDQGRYKAKNSRFNSKTSIQLILDAWRMVKPLVSTSADEPTAKPDRNIETIRQKFDGIISYAQLKLLSIGLADIFNFERKEITHVTPASYDIEFGDPVYSEDPLSFSEADDSKPNTILAVADKIVYTFSKGVNGPGGIGRKLHLVTREFFT